MSKYEKKADVVAKLLIKTYEKDIEVLNIVIYKGDVFVETIFTNKPDQMMVLKFIPFDTWDKIKNKIKKLIDSDGLCVVCCEKKNNQKTEIPGVGISDICQTCCEYQCWDCIKENFKHSSGFRCMVCRQCLVAYKHLAEDKPCDHAD